jgi:hypothetical protein
MSERHPGKEHELPSFAPAWGHPFREVRHTLQVDVLMGVSGSCWDEDVHRKGFMPTWTSSYRDFIGFRMVRPT